MGVLKLDDIEVSTVDGTVFHGQFLGAAASILAAWHSILIMSAAFIVGNI